MKLNLTAFNEEMLNRLLLDHPPRHVNVFSRILEKRGKYAKIKTGVLEPYHSNEAISIVALAKFNL